MYSQKISCRMNNGKREHDLLKGIAISTTNFAIHTIHVDSFLLYHKLSLAKKIENMFPFCK